MKSKLEELIEKLCPNGVEYKELGEICILTAGGDIPKNNLSKEKTEEYQIPIFSNGVGENALYGYTNIEKIKSKCVTISARGTIGYAALRKESFYPIVRLICAIPKIDLLAEFLCYFIQTLTFKVPTTGIPQLTIPMIKNIKIPIPPLEIQEKIVRILDKFTELTTEIKNELITELTLRKQQYEHYRDELLTFGDEVEWNTLEKTCILLAGGDIPKNNLSKEKTEEYQIPIFSNGVGENALYGYTNIEKIKSKCVTISARGTIGYAALRKESFYPVVRLICAIPKIDLLPEFLYYFIQTLTFKVPTTGIPQLTIPMIKNIKIPIPPLEEQKRIVEILDRFDKIINDIKEGLPAEIEMRQKQYEYYRDKLLNFKKLNSEG